LDSAALAPQGSPVRVGADRLPHRGVGGQAGGRTGDRWQLASEFQSAETADRQALAVWLFSGEQGKRPEPTRPMLEARRDELLEVSAALDVAIADALQERADYIVKNRKALVDAAAKDVDGAAVRAWKALEDFVSARADLVEASAAERAYRLFPDPSAGERYGNQTNVGLGLLKATQPLGIKAQLPVNAVVDVLRQDVAIVRETLSPNQRKALGKDEFRPHKDAVWGDDPRLRQWQQSERERLRAEAEYMTPMQLQALEQKSRG
jgi:hypothetical protein